MYYTKYCINEQYYLKCYFISSIASSKLFTTVAESRADLGVAISGIAGPGGGSPDRPVGTVCIAWKLKDKQAVRSTFLFEGNRNEVRYATVVKSLEEAIELIK